MDFIFLFVCYTFCLYQLGKVNANGQFRSSKSISNPTFDDLKITEGEIFRYQVKSEVRCTSLCNEKAGCLSVLYNKANQMCVLFDKDFTDVSSTPNVMEEGWQYLHVIKVTDSEQTVTSCVGEGLPGICSRYCLSYITRPAPVLFAELSGICGSYSGGELVKIDRGLKQYCVEQLLESENNGEVFIQGIRNESDNTWWYNDGTEMTYFNWNPSGQPNNNPGEIYVGVRKQNGYVWHDLWDDDLNAAVCQQT